MVEVVLPRLDDEYNESSIIFWHKQEGDSVKKGDVLVEVQTEKAVSEIEAEVDGIIEEIIVKRGEVASVGDTLAIIGDGKKINEENIASTNKTASESKNNRQNNFVRIAPRLRKLAKDLQVDLTQVIGTGKNGAITEEDIKKFHSNNEGEDLSNIRQTIAKRMKESLQYSAQLTETAYADVTNLGKIRANYERKLSWNTWIMHALVRALQEHPYMNGTFENNKWYASNTVELGMAVDTDEGLYVPVIGKACQLTVDELEEKSQQLAKQIREGTISAKTLSGSTFTITNLGNYGIHFFTPIINPPEVGILGVGSIESYVAIENGEVVERNRLPLSLTFDHQVIDGAPAAKFLQTIIKYLENPS